MDEWASFFSRCLDSRLEPRKFEKFTKLLYDKTPLPPPAVTDALLRPRKHSKDSLDPLVSLYVQILLQQDLIDVASLLFSLLRYSSFQPVKSTTQAGEDGNVAQKKTNLRWNKSYTQDEILIFGVTKVVTTGQRPKSREEVVGTVKGVTEWAKILVLTGAADDMLHEMGAGNAAQDQLAMAVRVAVGTLVMAVLENSRILTVLGKSFPKDTLKAFADSLAAFTPLLLNSAPMLAERLELFRSQTIEPLLPVDKKVQAANDEIDQIIDSTIALGMDSIAVVDLPIVNSRAGLYVYLNSLLVGRPIIDDDAIFTYLHNRYQGDIQTTCIDLIMSSFDVLANATFRNEPAHVTVVLRSFLINKVPLILAALAGSMFPPLTPEFCITEALSHVDTNAFPTFSSMFDESSSGNMFSDSVRQDFCFACCLHGLIAEESIERLLGEIPMQTLPAGGRYTKDDLVEQCLSDHERAETLLEELEHMDGNVGAVSQAITEVIGRLCGSKETISLKTLCSHLVRKPSSLDIMLLFDKPATILSPVCELLDGWRYDEDQGEYQPVYEEFGSILLLVLAFVYRYNLSTVDLGIHAHDSFIAKLLVQGAISKPMDDLTEVEKIQLDGWIRGLFNSEGGGLGDEPMSACPPQDFYLLVPTLFHQVVLAYSTGHLNDEILRGGLEYLVDTFLLPSLVGAMFWLSNHLWEARGDSNAIVQILQIVVDPSSNSNDASMMLASILNIVAKPLEHSLRSLQRSEPSRQDVEPISKALKQHLNFSRTAGSDHTELETWTSTQAGGLANSIRHTLQSLVQWSLTPGINVMPTSYTHRQILVGIRILGAKRLLAAIVEELKIQSASGNSAVAYDVVASIICAPDAQTAMTPPAAMLLLDETATVPQPLQRRLTLRDALKTEAENAPKIHKEDVVQAETLVRLFRRVESQVAGLEMAMEMPMQEHEQTGLLAGLDVVGDPSGAGGLMSGGQDIDDVMMGLGGDGGMGLGDDDILGSMKMEF